MNTIKIAPETCDCEENCDCHKYPSGAILYNGEKGNGSYSTVTNSNGELVISLSFMGVDKNFSSRFQMETYMEKLSEAMEGKVE
jgi:hypothetical protein